MNNRRTFVLSAALAALLVSTASLSAFWPFSKDKDGDLEDGDLTELTWEKLIPDDFVPPENPFATMSQEEIDKLLDGSEESQAELARLEEAFYYAPVVEELDGLRVKLPAYITPLEFDGQLTAKEFLLVPYVGACMHTPPPPANQVVHALSPETVDLPSMYEPVWAVGIIKAETVISDIAESGYRLELEKLLPYESE